MLDYNKLSKQFDEILFSHTKEDLENWLKLDKQKLLDELSKGSEVLYPYNNYSIINPTPNNNLGIEITSPNDYPMAA